MNEACTPAAVQACPELQCHQATIDASGKQLRVTGRRATPTRAAWASACEASSPACLYQAMPASSW